jgi:hypothetical protein
MGPKLITYGQLFKWLGRWDSLAMKSHLGYKFMVTSIFDDHADNSTSFSNNLTRFTFVQQPLDTLGYFIFHSLGGEGEVLPQVYRHYSKLCMLKSAWTAAIEVDLAT